MKILTDSGVTLSIRRIKPSDEKAFLKLARRDQEQHQPWIKVPRTKKAFQKYAETMSTDDDRGYLIIRRDTKALVGVIELRDIFLGDFKNAYVCYYAFSTQSGNGFIKAAMLAVIDIAFSKLKLHRLEANIQPQNSASIQLIRACGFTQEGYSPKFLRMNGVWCDHQRWALIKLD